MSEHHLVFKTELVANAHQKSSFASHFGATRFTYNCLLAWSIEEWQKYQRDPSLPRPKLNQASLQTTWTRELRGLYAPWYEQNSRDPYRHAASALAKAYRNFFTQSGAKQGYPKFKKRDARVAYATDRASLTKGGRFVHVPRIGKVKLAEQLKSADWLQRMGATLQETTFSRDSTGRIYASLRFRVIDNLALAFFRGKMNRKGRGFCRGRSWSERIR